MNAAWSLALLLGGWLSLAGADPLADNPGLRPVGSGVLSWWGFKLYDATLYAPGGDYRPERPHALEITYHTGFTREQLARATLKEIERLQGPRDDRETLLERFSALFIDVREGDRLTGLHRPGEGADFYGPPGYLGRLEDADLAAAFFAVWLDPRARDAGLRRDLLGDAR